jgi:hypothetical protein
MTRLQRSVLVSETNPFDWRAHRRRNLLLAFLVLSACLSLPSCKRAESDSLPQGVEFKERPSWHGNQRIGVVTVGLGVACFIDGSVGLPSYAVDDVGKGKVPKLHEEDASVLRLILRYVNPDSLRFAYLRNKFIVFSSPVARLCDPVIPPSFVLNGACNEYYSPLRPWGTTAAMGCYLPPRPWVSNDQASGTGCVWSANSKVSCVP